MDKISFLFLGTTFGRDERSKQCGDLAAAKFPSTVPIQYLLYPLIHYITYGTVQYGPRIRMGQGSQRKVGEAVREI